MRGNYQVILWHAFCALLLLFMLGPLLILILFCFKEGAVIKFPIDSFSLIWFETLFKRDAFWAAFTNSLVVSGSVGVISVFTGVSAAVSLAGMKVKSSGFNMAVLTLPVTLPPLVLGVTLLTYYSLLNIPLGLPTVIAGQLLFTQPFVILINYASLSKFQVSMVDVARDLGASNIRIFAEIVLPIVRPTIIGSALIAVALSLDDFLVTFFTIGGGNTLPTFLWGMIRYGANPSVNIIGTILMVMSIVGSVIGFRITRYRG